MAPPLRCPVPFSIEWHESWRTPTRRITMSAVPSRHRVRWLGASALLLAVVLTAGCNQAPPPKGDKTAEVVVTTPITSDVLDYQDFTGRLDALFTVDVRAHV